MCSCKPKKLVVGLEFVKLIFDNFFVSFTCAHNIVIKYVKKTNILDTQTFTQNKGIKFHSPVVQFYRFYYMQNNPSQNVARVCGILF